MTAQPLQDALRSALELLRQTGMKAAFAGGLAVIIWGRPRITQDVDMLLELTPDTVDAFLQAASDLGFSYDTEEAALLPAGGFIRLMRDDAASFPLDILVADTPLHQSALARVKRFELAGEQIPVISAEDLILMKLVAFRPKDTFDLETVIDAMSPKLDLPYLQMWADRLGLRARLETFLEQPVV